MEALPLTAVVPRTLRRVAATWGPQACGSGTESPQVGSKEAEGPQAVSGNAAVPLAGCKEAEEPQAVSDNAEDPRAVSNDDMEIWWQRASLTTI